MLSYIAINYKNMVDRALSDRKIGEIMGILLALIILCCMVSGQKIRKPSEEAAAMNSYISREAAEESSDLFVISEMGEEALPHGSYPECDVSGKSTPMVVKAGNSVDFAKTAEILPVSSVEADTRAAYRESEAVVEEPATVPTEAMEVPEEPAKDDEESFAIHNGFICDSSGKIIGCDGVSVTDGVLCLPFDGTCTGVAGGALASLGGLVYEIYIPANITVIDAGAFDGLTELMYIEVHPDNPVYKSSFGILSEK